MQMSHARRPDELRRALREQAGLDIVTLRPASGGESGTVYWATDRAAAATRRHLYLARLAIADIGN
jgi:hypothetical protein